jgi:predicted DNA repair protein MutK
VSAAEDASHHAALVRAVADEKTDLLALEQEKIKGAIRTDFILSAEIIVISLGTVQNSPLLTQLAVLCGIAVVMTAGVYGLVAGIVKLDDAGLHLQQRVGQQALARWQRSLGSGILAAAPYLMKTLSVAGTAAMFLVGGGILLHGVHVAAVAVEQLSAAAGPVWQAVINLLLNALTGMLAGALSLLGVLAFKRLRSLVG